MSNRGSEISNFTHPIILTRRGADGGEDRDRSEVWGQGARGKRRAGIRTA